MNRIHAHDLQAHVLLAICYCGTLIVRGSNVVNMILEFRFGGLQVVSVQADIAPFTKSLIGLRSPASICLHRIRQPVAALLEVSIDESVACAKQHDNHKDSPRHSKTCKRRAELVATSRRPYFCYYITHFFF